MRLEARELGVCYGERTAVRGVSLSARPGEVLAVIGANGSGKSSLLRALAGLVAHRGTISWDGAARPRGRIGYMPQETGVRAALTVFEVVLLGRLRSLALRVSEADLRAATVALEEVGVADLAGRRIGALSGGQRQLVFLAQVLAGDPAVLLLDEPSSALDIAHQFQVLALLRAVTRRRGLTTIAVLHDLNAAARFADRLVLLHQGRMIGEGEAAAVLCPELLRRAYGVTAAVLCGPDDRPVVVPMGVA